MMDWRYIDLQQEMRNTKSPVRGHVLAGRFKAGRQSLRSLLAKVEMSPTEACEILMRYDEVTSHGMV